MIIILSAPSGCGKSSIARELAKLDPKIVVSISATTRPPRNAEQDGVHYFFKKPEEFAQMELLEQAEIYGNCYGTPRDHVEQELAQGKKVIFDIDWQGAKQIMEKMSHVPILSIFLLPPSLKELENRLINRGDKIESIKRRLLLAEQEIGNKQFYDYNIVNRDLQETVGQIFSLIQSKA